MSPVAPASAESRDSQFMRAGPPRSPGLSTGAVVLLAHLWAPWAEGVD